MHGTVPASGHDLALPQWWAGRPTITVFWHACVMQILGSRGDMEAKIEEATRQKIDEINGSVQMNKDKAMQRLLKLVCDIKPELHANFSAK